MGRVPVTKHSAQRMGRRGSSDAHVFLGYELVENGPRGLLKEFPDAPGPNRTLAAFAAHKPQSIAGITLGVDTLRVHFVVRRSAAHNWPSISYTPTLLPY